MLITGLEPQRRRGRYNVYVDGEFAFGVHAEVAARFGLRRDAPLTSEALERIKREEETTLAQEKALRLLRFRARSEHELRSRLREKEFHPGSIDEAIERLRSLGYVNDLSFARALVHDTLLRRETGVASLSRVLRSRGVDAETIRRAISESGAADHERELALRAAERLLSKYRSSRKRVDETRGIERTAQALRRRGFDWQVIRSVLRALGGGADA